MKRTLRHLALGLAVLSVFQSRAWAQTGINVQTFNPSTSSRFVFLEDGFMTEWPKATKYFFGANYNWLNEPLVVYDATQTVKLFNYIDSIQTFDLMAGIKAASNVGIFVGLPIHYVSYPATTGLGSSPLRASSTVMGDLKLLGKIRVTNDSNELAVALVPEVHFPTGSNQDFVSDASTYIALRATLERKFENFTFVGNLGYAAASNAFYSDTNFSAALDYRKRLLWGAGTFIPFTDQWGMNVELSSQSSIPADKNTNPNDLYGGLRYQSDAWALTGGLSIGRIGGAQQNLRIVLGLRFNVYEETQTAPRPINYNPPTLKKK